MKINCHIKCALVFFSLTQSGFSYDSLVRHYDDRRIAHSQHKDVDNHTTSINGILANERLIDPNLHDIAKKKKVMQAVMASVIIHGPRHSLFSKPLRPVTNPVLLNHFKILGLTEEISLGLIGNRWDPNNFIDLATYSGIEKDTFLVWFSEVCIEHGMQDFVQIIKDKEAKQQRLKDELTRLTKELEKIEKIKSQFVFEKIRDEPHFYDGNIRAWTNDLWTAFVSLTPLNIPNAEEVKQKIMEAAQAANITSEVAARYKGLDAGFVAAQNQLQQIVGWTINKNGGDYSALAWSLIPVEGSTNSAIYNIFLLPAIPAVCNLYQEKIQEIEHEIQNSFRETAPPIYALPPVHMRSTIVSQAHSPLFMQTPLPPPPSSRPTRISLDEIPQFSNPIVTDEYKQLGTPFTLAVTEQDVNDASSALPALNQRQQELGFNGWRLGYTDAGDFHRRAESWSDKEYNHYFEQGILREIVFLLTGVGEITDHKVKDYSTEAQMRILLSLCKEMNLTGNKAYPFTTSVIASIKGKNKI
jgi:hypothetical protein